MTVKVTFEDNNSLVTCINCNLQEAREYYVGRYFNLGTVEDHMVKTIDVQEANK